MVPRDFPRRPERATTRRTRYRSTSAAEAGEVSTLTPTIIPQRRGLQLLRRLLRRGGCYGQLADLEQRNQLLVDTKQLVAERSIVAIGQLAPIGSATEADLIVGVAPRARRERRQQDLAEILIANRWSGRDACREPTD